MEILFYLASTCPAEHVEERGQSAGGTSTDIGNGIAGDASGNVYITGIFYGTATFGATSKTSAGNADIFVARLQQ